MALFAAGVCSRPPTDDFAERIVEAADELCCIRVAARLKFRSFSRVAALAILRRDQHDDFETVVIFYIRATALVCCPMTTVAINTCAGMFAALPVFNNTCCPGAMAGDTNLSLF